MNEIFNKIKKLEKRKLIFAATAICVLILSIGIYYFKSSRSHTADFENEKKSVVPVVKVTIVELKNLKKTFSTWTYLLPAREVVLRPPSGVQIKQVVARVGTRVKKDDNIISFDSELHRLRAELDKVEMDLKSMDYKVTMALAKKNFLSSNDYKQKTLEYKSQQIRAQISSIESNSNIRSPIDGVVAENGFREGDYIDQQNNLVIRVIDPSLLRISLSLPSSVIEKIKVNDTVSVGRDQTLVKGIIRSIAPSVDPKTGTILVDIDVVEKPAGWTVGQYAQVTATLEEKNQTPAVPAQSVVSENNRLYVYKLKSAPKNTPENTEARGLASDSADDSVEKVEIQVGISDSGFTEVTQGLAANDKVVVQGLSFVSDGSKVEVRE